MMFNFVSSLCVNVYMYKSLNLAHVFFIVILVLMKLNMSSMYCSYLLLRYASQNSLDESSQKHLPRPSGKEKPPYRNSHHTHRAFDVMNTMRK
jgi:hypothetical protein